MAPLKDHLRSNAFLKKSAKLWNPARQITRALKLQARRGINLEDLRRLPVPFPPETQQELFAKRVTEIHSIEEFQTAGGHRLKDLFQSMLHGAFSRKL